jgi:hypothetical protein
MVRKKADEFATEVFLSPKACREKSPNFAILNYPLKLDYRPNDLGKAHTCRIDFHPNHELRIKIFAGSRTMIENEGPIPGDLSKNKAL